jgi:hypothetical protein
LAKSNLLSLAWQKATSYPLTYTTIATTAVTVEETEEVVQSSASSGTTIFGIPGTEYFRTEMARFYNFYEEYKSILTGFFGMG